MDRLLQRPDGKANSEDHSANVARGATGQGCEPPPADREELTHSIATLPILDLPSTGETIDDFVLGDVLSDGRYSRLFKAIDRRQGQNEVDPAEARSQVATSGRQLRGGDRATKARPALPVAGDEHDVSVILELQLGPEDRTDAAVLRRVREAHRAVEPVRVGEREPIHALRDRRVDQVIDLGRSVEEGMVRVRMKLDPARHMPALWISVPFLGRLTCCIPCAICQRPECRST